MQPLLNELVVWESNPHHQEAESQEDTSHLNNTQKSWAVQSIPENDDTYSPNSQELSSQSESVATQRSSAPKNSKKSKKKRRVGSGGSKYKTPPPRAPGPSVEEEEIRKGNFSKTTQFE